MSLQLLGDRVLVQRDKAEEKTSGGLFVPQHSQEEPLTATVLEVGDAVTKVTAGGSVLLPKRCGTVVKLNGNQLHVVREEDIIGIILSDS